MMNFKKAVPRRAFLRGVGTTLALPLLDAMVPAFASAKDEAAVKPAVRLCMIYVPNGRIMAKWMPKTAGAAFEMPATLEPLTPFRDRFLVLSHLSSNSALVRPGEAMGNHGIASGAFLTGVHGSKDGRLGISADQIAAKELGKQTQLASLELTLDSPGLLGGGDTPVNDAFSNTISWSSSSNPLPMESNPRAVFERLFGEGDSTDAAARLARIQKERSILDYVSQDVSRALGLVGASDRNKLNEYLDGVRDIERRIQKAGEQASSSELPVMERPAGVPGRYDDHAKLMFDLQVLAYQSDLTRVITFVMAHEKSERHYPELGIDEGHHAMSHHQGDAALIAKVARIDLFQSQMFAYFLEKLQSTRDGDGSLLDHVAVLYGSGLSDGNLHKCVDLPILLAGGAGGQIKGGRHIEYPMDTPLTNLHVALLDMAGVRVDKFGDSSGELDRLSVA